MLIRIDEANDRPIYAQIADSVRADVASGRIGPGETLPPAREVATGLGINVHTVLRAYQQLRDEGLIDLKRRRGAVVTAAAAGVAELREEVRGLVERAAELGIGPALLAAVVSDTAQDPARRVVRGIDPRAIRSARGTRDAGLEGEVPAA